MKDEGCVWGLSKVFLLQDIELMACKAKLIAFLSFASFSLTI